MSDATCSADGCNGPLKARGLCKKHYKQATDRRAKYGEPLPPKVRKRRTCTIDDCDRPVEGRGWCPMHYARWRANGDPLVSRYNRVPMEERFWIFGGKRREADECWPWTGFVGDRGYGQFCINRHSSMQAHRMAYQLTVGPIPDDLELDHLCHNRDLSCAGGTSCLHRRCVNPAHLEPVTGEENLRRMWAKIAARKAA